MNNNIGRCVTRAETLFSWRCKLHNLGLRQSETNAALDTPPGGPDTEWNFPQTTFVALDE